MNKANKLLKLSLFGMAFFMVALIVTVNATTVNINHIVPIAQGWVNLSEANKSQSSNHATVSLTRKDNNEVTFTVRAKNTNNNWGGWQPGVVVNSIRATFRVNYEYNLGAGTRVQARFRNHNWSMNVGQVEGTFDYQ